MINLILCLLACTISGGLAAAVILLTKRLLKDKLSPAWHCYAWILVMLLLILPVTADLQLPELPELKLESVQTTTEPSSSKPVTAVKPTVESAPSATESVTPSTDKVTPVISQTTQPVVENPTAQAPAVESKPTQSAGTSRKNGSSDPDETPTSPGTPAYSIKPSTQNVTENQKTSADFLAWGGWTLLAIWLIGAVWYLGKQWSKYRYFSSMLRMTAEEADEETLELLRRVEWDLGFRIRRPMKLAVSPLTTTPMIVGLFHPTMYVPERKLDQRKLSLIFTHELTHHKYGDLIYKSFAQFVSALHWFNPFCRLMLDDIDFSCELCCDQRVRRHIGESSCKEYGSLLLELMSMDMAQNPSAGFSMDKKDLKRRLSLIIKPKHTSKVLSVVLAFSIAVTGTACSSVIAPEINVGGLLFAQRRTAVEQKQTTKQQQVNTKYCWGIYPLEAYTEGLPGMKTWVQGCQRDSKDKVYALTQSKDMGNYTMFRWFIYDPYLTKDSDWDIEGSLYKDSLTITTTPAASGEPALILITENFSGSDAGKVDTALNYVRNGVSVPCETTEAWFDLFDTLNVSIPQGKPQAPDSGFRFPIYQSEQEYYEVMDEFETCNGLNIAANLGTAVKPVVGGTVSFAGWSADEGYTVVVNHGNGWASSYSHLHSLKVKTGDVLKNYFSAIIGYVGSTGNTDRNMLHFELMYHGVPVDPADYMTYIAPGNANVPEAASDVSIPLYPALCTVCGNAEIVEEEGPCPVCEEGQMLVYDIQYGEWEYIGISACSAHGNWREDDIVKERWITKTYNGEVTSIRETGYTHITDNMSEQDEAFLLFRQVQNRFDLLFGDLGKLTTIYPDYSLNSSQGSSAPAYRMKQIWLNEATHAMGAFYISHPQAEIQPEELEKAVAQAIFDFRYDKDRRFTDFSLIYDSESCLLKDLVLVYDNTTYIPLIETDTHTWSADLSGVKDITVIGGMENGFSLRGTMTMNGINYAVDVLL